jgi:cathepsin F
VLVLLFVAALAVPTEDEVKVQFAEFIRKYNKQYTSHHEIITRFNNFKASLARAEQLQAMSTSAKFGVTKFSDMSPAEFQSTILMKKVDFPNGDEVVPPTTLVTVGAPATFDWRDHGAVTPVKDQEQCGSCWAFSATEAIESAWILKGHANASTVDLAPQQIVDCDNSDAAGCGGGFTESAYEYIIKAGGQEPEADYPYTGENGKCAFNAKDIDAKISGFTSIPKDETALSGVLSTTGPLSICLDAAHWQDYQSGVMGHLSCCPFLKCMLDHCVQLVGYNSTGSDPYWIVRNSWNTDWGIEGYIWLEMGENTCGITNDITWPTSM